MAVSFCPQCNSCGTILFSCLQGAKRGRWLLFAGTLIYQWPAGRFSVGPVSCTAARTSHEPSNLASPRPARRGGYCDVVMEYEPLIRRLVDEARQQGVSIIENTPILRLYSEGRIDTPDQTLEFDRVINAAGPWAARLLEASGIDSDFTLDHVRGSHLIVKASFPNALVLQAPGERRIIFVIPLDTEHVLLGTTEHKHDLTDPIVCTDAETAYLLGILNQHLSETLSKSDIVSSFAGIRPIVRPHDATIDDMSSASRAAIETTGRLIASSAVSGHQMSLRASRRARQERHARERRKLTCGLSRRLSRKRRFLRKAYYITAIYASLLTLWFVFRQCALSHYAAIQCSLLVQGPLRRYARTCSSRSVTSPNTHRF